MRVFSVAQQLSSSVCDTVQLKGGNGGGGFNPSSYSFNGSTMYATHANWSPLGDASVYVPVFSYDTDNDDGYVVDDSSFPISEFGRVGANYHSGTIENLSYTDTSPLLGVKYYLCDVGRQIVFSGFNLNTAIISFDMIYNSGDQVLCGGSSDILSAASDVLVGGPYVDYIELDGSRYDDSPLVDGQHCRIVLHVSQGTWGFMGGISGFGSQLSILNQE